MQPIKFKESNVVFAENQDEYLSLPAYKLPHDSEGKVVSCWKLTWKERFQMLFRGRFYITVLTFNGPIQPILPEIESSVLEDLE